MTFSVFLTGKGVISEMLADQCKNRAMYHSSKESHEMKWGACVDSQDEKQTRVVVYSKLQGTVRFFISYFICLKMRSSVGQINKQNCYMNESHLMGSTW